MRRYLSVIAMLCVLAAAGCAKLDDPGSGKKTDVSNPKRATEWIDKYMREWYLWPEELAGKARNYELGYQAFFISLLTTKKEDGKTSGNTHRFYSYIERKEVDAPSKAAAGAEGKFSFGVNFITFYYENSNVYTFAITHVVPGSDAEKKGLKRGDEITSIDGTTITESNYTDLYEILHTPSSASAITLKGVHYKSDRGTEAFTCQITPAITVESPVLVRKKIEADGKTIGYLAYGSFKSGYPDIEDQRFNNELKTVMKDFAASPRVDEVVIDLRNNGGGLVSCCRLLASMLVPAAKNQAAFAINTYNANITAKYLGGNSETISFLTVEQMSDASRYGTDAGVNLNLSRVYLLMNQFSASSSEMLANALRGVGVTVVIIGERTTGKSVGMSLINRETAGVTEDGIYKDGDKYHQYNMWPVTFKSCNARNVQIPPTGLIPDYPVDEYKDLGTGLKALGDPAETSLAAAISLITRGTVATSDARSRADAGLQSPRATIVGGAENRGMRHVPDFTAR